MSGFSRRPKWSILFELCLCASCCCCFGGGGSSSRVALLASIIIINIIIVVVVIIGLCAMQSAEYTSASLNKHWPRESNCVLVGRLVFPIGPLASPSSQSQIACVVCGQTQEKLCEGLWFVVVVVAGSRYAIDCYFDPPDWVKFTQLETLSVGKTNT